MKFLILFMILNPMLGPHNDWAPLNDAYQVCADTANTRFEFITCTVGAYDRAIHPTWKA